MLKNQNLFVNINESNVWFRISYSWIGGAAGYSGQMWSVVNRFWIEFSCPIVKRETILGLDSNSTVNLGKKAIFGRFKIDITPLNYYVSRKRNPAGDINRSVERIKFRLKTNK